MVLGLAVGHGAYLLKTTMTLELSMCRTCTDLLGDRNIPELLIGEVKAMFVLATPCWRVRSKIRKLLELARTGLP